jgi:hypothetical protein
MATANTRRYTAPKELKMRSDFVSLLDKRGTTSSKYHNTVTTTTTTVAPTGDSATALFLTESGDTTAISFDDIHQGQIGDCFMLSSLGELAMHAPSAISSMIHQNSNGTQTVTLYTDANGSPVQFSTSHFAAKQVTVNDTFYASGVNNAAGQDVVNGVKEIWVQVVEKAFAALNSSDSATLAAVNAGTSLAPIANGGYTFLAMETLTGNAASWVPSASVSATTLQNAVAANDLIGFDTLSNPAGYGLVGNHTYMFDHMVGSGASASVVLDNPWGFNNPSPIPVSQLAGCFAQVDFCKA